MTDDFDVLTRLVDYHDHIDAPSAPVADDVRRGRRRLARRRSLAAGGAALAVAGIVLTASMVSRSDLDGAPDPAHTPTPSETHTAIDPVPVNGRITSAERYLGVKASGYAWRSFDPVSETGLVVTGGDPNSAFHSVEESRDRGTDRFRRDAQLRPRPAVFAGGRLVLRRDPRAGRGRGDRRVRRWRSAGGRL